MVRSRAIAFRRMVAFGVDWLIILAWGGLLFGIAMAVSSGEMPRTLNPWVSQAVGFLSMTLPVVLYFSLSESSTYQATFGKRVLGLKVVFNKNERASCRVTLVRNAVKFTPWEIGHLVANQAAFSGDDEISIWVYCAMAVSMIIPVWWIGTMFFSGLTPYDRLSSTEVVSN